MRRILVLVFGLLIGCSAVLFSLDMSAGALVDYSRVNEHLSGTTSGGTTAYENVNYPALVFGAFLDVTYVQLSVGFDTTLTGKDEYNTGGSTTSVDITDHLTYVSAELLGKYPFDLGMVRLFPLLGIEYDLNLSYTDKSGNDLKAGLADQQKKDLSQFWLKVGAGADIDLTKHIYLRPEVLFGYKLPTQTDKDAVDAAKTSGATDVSLVWTRWDFGLMFGYRF